MKLSIINQIFLGILVKSVINIKYGKMPLNWSPDKICGKVFNEPWFSLFVTCLISYLFFFLKRKRSTKLKASKKVCNWSERKQIFQYQNVSLFTQRAIERCSVENVFCNLWSERLEKRSREKVYSSKKV